MPVINLLKDLDVQNSGKVLHKKLLRIGILLTIIISLIVLLVFCKKKIMYLQYQNKISVLEQEKVRSQKYEFGTNFLQKEKELILQINLLQKILDKKRNINTILELLQNLPKKIKLLTLEKRQETIFIHGIALSMQIFNQFKDELAAQFNTIEILDLHEQKYWDFKLALQNVDS